MKKRTIMNIIYCMVYGDTNELVHKKRCIHSTFSTDNKMNACLLNI